MGYLESPIVVTDTHTPTHKPTPVKHTPSLSRGEKQWGYYSTIDFYISRVSTMNRGIFDISEQCSYYNEA